MMDDGVFISYRRDGGSDKARIFSEYLEGQGFKVFLDVDSLTVGHFNSQLLDQIERRASFLLVCSPGCLDRCADPGDWIRTEVAHAIKLGKTIVPVVMPGFEWPSPEQLPQEIRELQSHNAFSYNFEHWKPSRKNLAARFRVGLEANLSPAQRFIKVFLPRVGKLAAARAGGAVASDDSDAFLFDAAESFLDGATPTEVRAAIEAIVQHPSRFGKDVDAAVASESDDVRAAAKLYFGQMPGAIQQSLRRTQDRKGLTVPSDCPLSRADDLLRLIPRRMPRFKPGDSPVVGSDLVLTGFLGSGGFGEVWRAKHHDRPHSTEVVLKFCTDAQAARSLKKEVELLDRIRTRGRHPNIVELIYPHLRCSPPCLEYEFVDGGDLSRLMEDRTNKPFTPSEIAKIMVRIATPVAFAHEQGIVHRDLKPQNVMVARKDGKAVFKITDFGIGGIIQREAFAQSPNQGASMGATISQGTYTPIYSSPQQQQGGAPDKRDDVFALGVIWYQLLCNDITKEPPRGSGWKLALGAKGAPEKMIGLLERCLETELEFRLGNAGILLNGLNDLMRVSPEPSVPIPPLEAPSFNPIVAALHPPVRAIDPVPYAVQMSSKATVDPTGKAIAGLVLGLVGLLAACVPLVGFPVTIVGLILSLKGMKSTKRGVAIAGLILSIIGIVATIVNSVMGAIQGANGQQFWQ